MRVGPSSPWQVVVLVAPLLTGAGPVRAESWILPSSSFRPGANGAEYRTDVRILNQGAAAVTVEATFFDQATSETIAASPFRVEARSQAAFDNVLHSLFGREPGEGAYGPIRFEATGPILVAANVNNVNACGAGAVAGQWLPALAVSQALRAGVIGQLAVSASTASGYRTNVAFVNPSGAPATARLTVRRGGGALLATGSTGPIPANGFWQVALDALPGVAGTTDTNLWLEFTSDEPVLAYATVVHNVSGDPFAVVASPDAPAADAEEITFTLPGGVPLVMVRIPAGTFRMGSPESERGRQANESPQREVTLSSDYYIGKYEVTQAQWRAVMGKNPSTFAECGDDCPVEDVSWQDIRGDERVPRTAQRAPRDDEVPAADRGGVGASGARGDPVAVLVRGRPRRGRRLRRERRGGRLDLVVRQLRREDPPRLDEAAESLRPPRDARQRGRVGGGRLRELPLDSGSDRSRWALAGPVPGGPRRRLERRPALRALGLSFLPPAPADLRPRRLPPLPFPVARPRGGPRLLALGRPSARGRGPA